MSTTQQTPRERLEALALELLDKLEADAKRGKLPTVAELNGARRLITTLDREREQARALEEANALTRG